MLARGLASRIRTPPYVFDISGGTDLKHSRSSLGSLTAQVAALQRHGSNSGQSGRFKIAADMRPAIRCDATGIWIRISFPDVYRIRLSAQDEPAY
jgi:hypothetical protein